MAQARSGGYAEKIDTHLIRQNSELWHKKKFNRVIATMEREKKTLCVQTSTVTKHTKKNQIENEAI